MTRRTLFIEVTPDATAALTHCAFNASTIAPAGKIALSNSNLTALYNGTFTSVAGVFGNVALTSGQWYWETRAEVASAPTSAVGIVCVDQAANTASTTKLCVGVQSTGAFVYNGVTTATLGATAIGARIGHWLDMDAQIYRVWKGGAWSIAAQGFPVGAGWAPIMQAGATGAGWTLCTGSNVYVGVSPFQWTKPSGASMYGSYGAATPTVQRLASRHFTTPNYVTGTTPLAATFYDGRISPRSDIRMLRQMTVWPWGNAGAAQPVVGTVELWNGDGGLDAWKGYNWRDKIATLAYIEGEQPGTISSGITWAFAIVDKVEFLGDTVRITFGDNLSKLDKALQSTNYGDQAVSGNFIERTLADVGDNNEGLAIPTVIGSVQQAEPFNVNPAAGKREFQFAQGEPVYSMLVYDKCDPWDELITGTDITRTSRTDGFRMAAAIAGPLGKTTADLVGPMKRGLNFLTSASGGAFTTWSGSPSTPSGWARVAGTENATCKFQNNGGACQIISDSSVTLAMRYSTSAITTVAMEVQFTVTSITTPGAFSIRNYNGTNATFTRVQVYGTGTYRVIVPAPAGSGGSVVEIWSGNTGGSINVTIDNMDAWVVTPRLNIQDCLEYLLVNLGGFSSGDMDATSFSALATKMPATLGYYAKDQANLLDVVRQFVNSVGGFIFVDRFGKFRVGRIELTDTSTPALSLTKDDIVGDVACELDLAKGLSTNLAGLRNWSPTDANSMATSVTASDKLKWSKQYQAQRSALGIVHATYTQADNQEPFGTLIQDATWLKAEASRWATLYAFPRYFYRLTVLLDLATANTLNPGDVVNVTLARYDLAAGKNLMLVSIQHRFWSQAVDLVLWG